MSWVRCELAARVRTPHGVCRSSGYVLSVRVLVRAFSGTIIESFARVILSNKRV